MKIQQRRDTSANWTKLNPVLAEGEIGFETDTNKFKFGNGKDAWNKLSFVSESDVPQNLTSIKSILFDGGGNISSITTGDSQQLLVFRSNNTVEVGSRGNNYNALYLDGDTIKLAFKNPYTGNKLSISENEITMSCDSNLDNQSITLYAGFNCSLNLYTAGEDTYIDVTGANFAWNGYKLITELQIQELTNKITALEETIDELKKKLM